MKFQVLKGMNDILPEGVREWQFVEKTAREFLESRGFQEIRTPILEPTDLFSRSIGEASDIVHKEMYTFVDRGGRSVTLRPEMTAGVVRAAIENHLLRGGIQRLYYMGPMFRAERPQAGRKRQFHQIGVEILGAGPDQDLELLVLADGLLKHLGVPDAHIKVNNLGTAGERKIYETELRKYLSKFTSKLCGDCQFRIEKNVLRVFDCKVTECREIIESAPKMVLDESEKLFQNLLKDLKSAGVSFEVDRKIVRGLDYYNFCVFEATAGGLGSQDAICAGGRYDGLIKDLGGPEEGACGFAMGIERLLMSLGSSATSLEKMISDQTVYFAPLVERDDAKWHVAKDEGDILLQLLKHGIRVVVGKRSANLRDHLKKANELHARFILIRGDQEKSKGMVAIKDLSNGVQKEVSENEVIQYFLSVSSKSV